MLEINKNNFIQEVLGEDKVVVADFWASWCGPCKMLAPVLEEISSEMKNVKFVKINIDDNPNLAQQFRVASIPTLMVFKDGDIKNKIVGFRPKSEIVDLVSKHV
ncbi:thioredoxin [Clostridium collagenovorans DSM 3089]|uniref:Thioredoxin n=2 Tax=Clostridium TaxID=1485 RepID=A0A1M5WTJ8_9CLOT|nr:thioredoxin [Clostridium collagenovorans DSM 3089]